MAPKPNLAIPPGSPISVRVINTTTIQNVPFAALAGPAIKGLTHLPPAPAFSFLLTHASGRRVLFDLGTRKDWETGLPASVRKRLREVGFRAEVSENVLDVLERGGVEGREVEAVVWSHWHWDHTGDPNLIVGPGFKSAFLPGAPPDDESHPSQILASDYAGRNLRELDFTGPDALRIGRFRALDYFGDGSFYLLDSPGHAVGHLCGLARTTSRPDTFVFMGGDAAHHGSEFRPSAWVPLPEAIEPSPMTGVLRGVAPFCPGALVEELLRERGMDPAGPLATPNMGHDIPETVRTIEKMSECDGDEDVFVVFAHDDTVRDVIDYFPKEVNGWKERGWGKRVRWAFLKDLEEALSEVKDRLGSKM